MKFDKLKLEELKDIASKQKLEVKASASKKELVEVLEKNKNDYSLLTIAQLKAITSANDVTVSGTTKADYVGALGGAKKVTPAKKETATKKPAAKKPTPVKKATATKKPTAKKAPAKKVTPAVKKVEVKIEKTKVSSAAINLKDIAKSDQYCFVSKDEEAKLLKDAAKDNTARRTLLLANKRLVKNLVDPIAVEGKKYDELFLAGLTGLDKAITEHDGVSRLSSAAKFNILNEISKIK